MRPPRLSATRRGGGGGGGTSFQPYSLSSAFNTPIPANPPIHPDNALMISSANFWLNGPTNAQAEWLGPGQRVNYYRGDTSQLGTIQMYANNNGWVGAGPFTMGMPSWMAAVLGPVSQTGDANISIVDSVTGTVTECWHCTPPGYTPRNSGFPSNRWNCSSYRQWPGEQLNGLGYGAPHSSAPVYHPGTSASLIQLACGLLVPEDFADCFAGGDPGTVIPHALRTDCFCGSNGTPASHPKFVHPAYNADGTHANGIPFGARVQLDPAIDVTAVASINAKPEPWRSALIKICRTLQVYGVIPVDSMAGPGGDLDAGTRGSVKYWNATQDYQWPWDAAGLPWSANPAHSNGVPYDLMDNFRVIDWNQWTGA